MGDVRISCLHNRRRWWYLWYQLRNGDFSSGLCCNISNCYTPLAIHQVQLQHQLMLKRCTLTTFTSSHPRCIPQAAVCAASRHSHPEHLCSTRCTLGTLKTLMPLTAPAKSRNKYKERREKYSGALSIQVSSSLYRNKVGREAQLLIAVSPTQQTA